MAGIVLVGGRSTRMGTAKAGLEWHGSTLVQRTVGIAPGRSTGRCSWCGRRGSGCRRCRGASRSSTTRWPGGGPLQGIATGLAAAAGHAATAAVCAVDLPLLHPAFIRRVVREVRADAALEIALPVAGGHAQPLAAAYRTVLAPRIAELVDAGTLRVQTLFERCRVLTLDESALLADRALAAADPRLESLLDVNTPAEYQEARGRLAPSVQVGCFGALAGRPDTGPRTVRAATARAAAAAAGLTFDRSVIAVVDEPGAASHSSVGPRAAAPARRRRRVPAGR